VKDDGEKDEPDDRLGDALKLLEEVAFSMESMLEGEQLQYVDLDDLSKSLRTETGAQGTEDTEGSLYVTATIGEVSDAAFETANNESALLEGGEVSRGPLTSSPEPARIESVARVAESPGIVDLGISVISRGDIAGRNLGAVLTVLEEEGDREQEDDELHELLEKVKVDYVPTLRGRRKVEDPTIPLKLEAKRVLHMKNL